MLPKPLPPSLLCISIINCERLKIFSKLPWNYTNLKAGDYVMVKDKVVELLYSLTFKRDKFDWIGAQSLNLAVWSNFDPNTHDYVINHPAIFMLYCAVTRHCGPTHDYVCPCNSSFVIVEKMYIIFQRWAN